MSRSARAGQVVLVVLGLLCVVFSASVYAAPDPFEPDANAMIASFGVGFGLMVIALAVRGLSERQPWAWVALWLLPAFFLSHVALIGTVLPDLVFAVIAAGALVATRPRSRVYDSPGPSWSAPSSSRTTA